MDRLILYESRVENGMLRMLKEFKKQQVPRLVVLNDLKHELEQAPYLKDLGAYTGKILI